MPSGSVAAGAAWEDAADAGAYRPLTSAERGRYDLVYQTAFQAFGDSTMLGWVPPTGGNAIALGLVQAALERAPKFVLEGPARLPLP